MQVSGRVSLESHESVARGRVIHAPSLPAYMRGSPSKESKDTKVLVDGMGAVEDNIRDSFVGGHFRLEV